MNKVFITETSWISNNLNENNQRKKSNPQYDLAKNNIKLLVK